MTWAPARAVGCGLALLLVPACTPPAPESEVEFRVPVFTHEVATGTVEDLIVATGTLRAREVVSLRTETSGLLIIGRAASGAKLAEGDAVAAGAVIAEVTGDDVKLAARTAATRQRYETASYEYQSRKRLFAEGLISESDLNQAQSTLAEAQLEWERSQWTESRSRMVSPIAGTVLRLGRDDQGQPVADGQLVPQGFVVAQIAPAGDLVADVDVLGSDLARVREGLVVRARQHAWADRTFDGRVVRLSPTLDPATRVLRAEVYLDNRDRLLRPGMFVEVSMIAERREGVPVVPREAVAERGGSKVVFVLEGQRVSQREVELGFGDDAVVEVRSGAKPGERVVVRGLETLVDGTRVRVSGA